MWLIGSNILNEEEEEGLHRELEYQDSNWILGANFLQFL